MAKKIFVGNLGWNVRDEELYEAFKKFGKLVEVVVIFDRQSNRSKGFGFVTFEEANDALNAIAEMNGKDLQGRPLRVNEANERDKGGGGRRP